MGDFTPLSSIDLAFGPQNSLPIGFGHQDSVLP